MWPHFPLSVQGTPAYPTQESWAVLPFTTKPWGGRGWIQNQDPEQWLRPLKQKLPLWRCGGGPGHSSTEKVQDGVLRTALPPSDSPARVLPCCLLLQLTQTLELGGTVDSGHSTLSPEPSFPVPPLSHEECLHHTPSEPASVLGYSNRICTPQCTMFPVSLFGERKHEHKFNYQQKIALCLKILTQYRRHLSLPWHLLRS